MSFEDFSKFEKEDAIKIGQMIKAETLAADAFKLDKSRIAFSSKFNSYDVEKGVDSTLAGESVSNLANEEGADSSNASEVKAKTKKSITSVLLTILIILCMLSIIGVVIINKIIGNDINGLINKLKAVQIELSNKEDMLNVCDLCALNEDGNSVSSVYDTINLTDLGGIELAYADIRADGCTATYYVKGDECSEVLLDEISRNFTVEAVTELNTKKQNGITYYQKSIEIDY